MCFGKLFAKDEDKLVQKLPNCLLYGFPALSIVEENT